MKTLNLIYDNRVGILVVLLIIVSIIALIHLQLSSRWHFKAERQRELIQCMEKSMAKNGDTFEHLYAVHRSDCNRIFFLQTTLQEIYKASVEHRTSGVPFHHETSELALKALPEDIQAKIKIA